MKSLVPPPPPSSDYFIPKIKILHYDVFIALFGLDSRKAYGPNGVHPVALKNCASELAPCLVKLFYLCLSTSTYPSCWMFAPIQPVPKKGDRSNPSNYRSIDLISCLSKAFESVFNEKIMRYLSAHNLLSDCQYGFQKGWSTGDLVFLTESWSSSFRDFGETFAVGFDTSKAFDRVWHKSLISKLPFYGFYPSLCTFISSFLSDRSIIASVIIIIIMMIIIIIIIRRRRRRKRRRRRRISTTTISSRRRRRRCKRKRKKKKVKRSGRRRRKKMYNKIKA